MSWIQFWLLTAAIYDAAYRLKNGGKHFIITISICLMIAFGLWGKQWVMN